jgi:DNA-binding response OmpR family regulator
VYEARTFQACRTMIAASPASIVVALWTESTSADVVRLVGRMRREFPAVRILAVADRKAEPHRWQILEAGIVWLCTSPRELAPIVEIIRRHLEQVPEPSLTPEQRVWARLPWPRAAERAGTGRS